MYVSALEEPQNPYWLPWKCKYFFFLHLSKNKTCSCVLSLPPLPSYNKIQSKKWESTQYYLEIYNQWINKASKEVNKISLFSYIVASFLPYYIALCFTTLTYYSKLELFIIIFFYCHGFNYLCYCVPFIIIIVSDL